MSEPRPFRILGLQQIAIGAPDKARLAGAIRAAYAEAP